jgi:hypothetical protein
LANPPTPTPPAPTDAEDFGRAPIQPDLLATGIVSGPGNNGTANTAHMTGQAGTAGTFLGSPRQTHFGQPGGKPQ